MFENTGNTATLPSNKLSGLHIKINGNEIKQDVNFIYSNEKFISLFANSINLKKLEVKGIDPESEIRIKVVSGNILIKDGEVRTSKGNIILFKSSPSFVLTNPIEAKAIIISYQ